MKNSTWLIIPLFSLFIYSTTLAQNGAVPDTIGRFKWEIGTDLLWLINKNILPKYSLILRHKIGNNGAIRLRGGINYIGNATTKYDDRESKSYQLRLGYEHRNILKANKVYLYYGIEAFYSYDYEFFNDYSHSVIISNPGGSTSTSTLFLTKETEIGSNIFVGYKRFIEKNLSISLESSFQISSWKKNVTQFSVDSFDYHNTNYRVLPFSTLNLSFHF